MQEKYVKYIVMRHFPEWYCEKYASNKLGQADENISSKLRRTIENIVGIVGNSKVSAIFHSGLFRSRQTAEMIANGIGYKGKFIENRDLCEEIPENIVRPMKRQELKILVSHEPPLEDFLDSRVYEGDAFLVEFDDFNRRIKKIN